MKKRENGREKNQKERVFQTNDKAGKLKKYLSIYDLLLANGGKRIAAVMALAVLAEGVLLYIMMGNESAYYENIFARGGMLPLELGFLLLAIVMIDPMKAEKNHVNYTLRRLRVKPTCLYFSELLYIFSMFLMFWGFSTLLLYGVAVYFTENISQAVNKDLGVLIAFARTTELNMLIPIGNPTLALRNIIGIAALSAAMARFNFFIRNGEKKLILQFLTVWIFTDGFSTTAIFTDRNIVAAVAMALLGVSSILSVIAGAEDTEDERNESEPPYESAKAEPANENEALAENEVCEEVSL